MTAPIPVLLNGASGRMGQVTAKMLINQPEFTLVGQLGRRDKLANMIKETQAEIVIDFTHPDVVFQNTQTILDNGARAIVGTTGLQSQQLDTLRKRCHELRRGSIIAPNFSIGVILMMRYAQAIAKYFPRAEIIEMHHDGKADSPSGTALRTAELLAAACSNINQPAKDNREIVSGARGANHHHVPIHAIRLPGLVAHQQVIFGETGETLSIGHNAIDRECYMPGLLLACKKVMELKDLVYGLENIL